MAKITRTVETDITPDELGRLFAGLCDIDQAAFFTAVADESRAWPSGGWSLQALNIAQRLDLDGRAVVRAIAEGLES